MASPTKLWGGRFTTGTDPTLEELNTSLHIDRRLYAEDIQGSQAYARGLTKISLLTEAECKSICEGLDKVKVEWENGTIQFKEGDEDVHTVNERRLKEIIGIAATKLHVGRSRNDQVITDLKLWMRKNLKDLYENMEELIKVMMMRAIKEIDILMPGYTHLQRAQPVRWSHWLLSHAWSLKSSSDRLQCVLHSLNTLPLGSGALAGNPFPVNRLALAFDLGFRDITGNSMHAVGDRDFVADFLFCASLLASHLSRLAEDLVLHSVTGHAWSLKSSSDRIQCVLHSLNTLPLGSGALAGNPFPVNRLALAFDLGFRDITGNSMHAVGDRDFVADFLFCASLLASHLSRLAEDLVLYSTKEFGFVRLDDGFSTGSSLMPQKRNPDSLELIRGSCGYVHGQCSGFMMTLKSLPSTYNKDLQYDKEAIFNTYDKVQTILKVATGTIRTLQVNPKNCVAALSYEMLATDLAYYLVRKGIAFRQAHHIAGQVVTEAEKKGILIHDLTLEELKRISDHFEADVSKVWNYENSVEQYQAAGGTSKSSVLAQISALEEWLNAKKHT